MELLRKRNNALALEIINAQGAEFGSHIEAIMTRVSEKIIGGKDVEVYKSYRDLLESAELKELTALVFNRLGLRIELICNNALAAILPFYSNKNHIFLDDFWRGEISVKEQDAVLKKAQARKGFVDLEKAKVGGIFSEYVNPVYMNFHDLFANYNLSPAEVTGIFLHELGHGFYVCEYADRMDTINQVLANVAVELRQNREKNLTYVYRELQTVNKNIKMSEVEELVSGNRVVAGARWFKVIAGTVGQQLTDPTYDQNAFEQLADNFANRFGYGRELVTGLDKLYAAGWYPEKSRSASVFAFLVSVAVFIGMAVMIVSFALQGVIVFSAFFAMIFISSIIGTGTAGKDHTYDELKDRYQRVRNDFVELLKNMSLPRPEAKDIVDKIAVVDRVIKETYKYKPFMGVVSDLLLPSNWRAINSIQEQQLMEQLVSNDLFVKAAQLRTL